MTNRRLCILATAGVVVLGVGWYVSRKATNYLAGVERYEQMTQLQPPATLPAEVTLARKQLFDALRPVTISNCALERIGGRNDGSYLMCGNLLDRADSAYSYGIGGTDRWGCDISKQAEVRVHQYDCFNPTRPWCWRGDTVFHDECVGATAETIEGRAFDSVAAHLAHNGDSGTRLVMKIDVEGAEWDTLLAMPDATLAMIDQLAVEFHWGEDPALDWVHDPRYFAVIERLKQFFEVAHLHFNNITCVGNLAPFPASAFEVLFVSKQLAVVDPARQPVMPHPADTRNRWWVADCQIP